MLSHLFEAPRQVPGATRSLLRCRGPSPMVEPIDCWHLRERFGSSGGSQIKEGPELRRRLLILASGFLVIGLTGCGQAERPRSTTTTRPEATTTTRAGTDVLDDFWLTIAICRSEETSYFSAGSIWNETSGTKSYRFTVLFEDSIGRRLGDHIVNIDSLAAGEIESWWASAVAPAGTLSGFRCRVQGVEVYDY